MAGNGSVGALISNSKRGYYTWLMQWQKQCKFSAVDDNRQEVLHAPQDPKILKKLLTRKLGT